MIWLREFRPMQNSSAKAGAWLFWFCYQFPFQPHLCIEPHTYFYTCIYNGFNYCCLKMDNISEPYDELRVKWYCLVRPVVFMYKITIFFIRHIITFNIGQWKQLAICQGYRVQTKSNYFLILVLHLFTRLSVLWYKWFYSLSIDMCSCCFLLVFTLDWRYIVISLCYELC